MFSDGSHITMVPRHKAFGNSGQRVPYCQKSSSNALSADSGCHATSRQKAKLYAESYFVSKGLSFQKVLVVVILVCILATGVLYIAKIFFFKCVCSA